MTNRNKHKPQIPSWGNKKATGMKAAAELKQIFSNTNEVDKLCEEVITGLLGKQSLQSTVSPDASLCIQKMLFITIALRDLNSIIIAVSFAAPGWARRFQIRSAATHLYEIGDDLPSVLDGKFYDACKQIGVASADVKSIQSTTKTFKQFRKKHETEFRKIRKTAGAHRDHDPSVVISTIESIDQDRYFKIIKTALQNLVMIQRSLVPVYNKINENNHVTLEKVKDLLEFVQNIKT